MTPRENYLIAAKGGKPEYVPVAMRDSDMFAMPFWKQVDPETGRDFLNIKWVRNDAGMIPDCNVVAMDDVTRWRELVHFPDLSAMDWEDIAAKFEARRDPNKAKVAVLNTAGLFLIPIDMMGWVDGLCAIYEEPEELEAFISAICDFLVELAGYYKKYIKPDIIYTGDDLASRSGPFVSPEIWKKMYKPYFKRIVEACHDAGALCEFHNCGNCDWLIGEYIEIGVDICQLPEPNEQLLKDKERFGGRLVLTGGWDRHGPGSLPGADEETVRQSVRDAVDTYGKDGALIFWDGGIVGTSEDSMNKRRWVDDEIEIYGREVYRK